MADIDMMPVNEIASDIFEGRFSAKFAKSAEEAYSVIPVLYKRYFGMHTPEVCETLEDGCTTEAFTDLCYTMSGVKKPSWRMYMPPSEAGMVIEQMSILTTHNLYPLLLLAGFPFYQFDQRKAVLDTWAWILAEFGKTHMTQGKRGDYLARLHSAKNIAFAWRNLVLYLSMHSDRSISENKFEVLPPHVGLIEMTKVATRSSLSNADAIVDAFLVPLAAVVAGEDIAHRKKCIRGWTNGDGVQILDL